MAPNPRYVLASGTTVLVDEAGMVCTPALARLVALASSQDWRLVLTGDPYQLQAVGRGGLFQELCATGRAHELARIHRFDAPWEAAACLQLRRGDSRGLDAYIEHGRLVPGTIEEHLGALADLWLRTADLNGTIAISASSNEHVDLINAYLQRVRAERGQLDTSAVAPIGGGERACVGDHVVTRRNVRRITTSTGEPIRNRDQWEVTEIGADGSLAVSSRTGHGTAVLPPDYAQDHVRLGYAATEHGHQGDTVTIGVELATAATTRRGLYVAATRGRESNQILVVTESHDTNEARDVLEGVLATDRSDVPATTQRRELAKVDRAPGRRVQLTSRCAIPAWVAELRTTVDVELAAVHRRIEHAQVRSAELQAQLPAAKRQLAAAETAYEPWQPVLQEAFLEVRAARERWWSANNRGMRATGRTRRQATKAIEVARTDLDQAASRETNLRAAAQPAGDALSAAVGPVQNIEHELNSMRATVSGATAADVAALRNLAAAIDTWQRWAGGWPVSDADVIKTVMTLRSEQAADFPACELLANAMERWAESVNLPMPTRAVAVARPDRTTDFGIDL